MADVHIYKKWLKPYIGNFLIFGVFLIVGFATYGRGLSNGFVIDDYGQILNNETVHSISNIREFFLGGTFAKEGGDRMRGSYYRPIVSVVNSSIYTLFGPNPFYFHIFQLLLFVLSCFLLYIFFTQFLRKKISLLLALIFLVHPINSQVVYSIPNMQDVLYFVFGMAAILILLKTNSKKAIIPVSVFLALSLFSKETGLLFIFVCCLLLLIWSRKRFTRLIAYMVPFILLNIILRYFAVGFSSNPNNAPIIYLGFTERLAMIPSIISFYIVKIFYPGRPASAYYWIHNDITFGNTLMPLMLVVLVIAIYVYLIRRMGNKDTKKGLIFFAVWSAIGFLLVSHIFPLDMTVSDSWALFPLVGIFSIVGLLVERLRKKTSSQTVAVYAFCFAATVYAFVSFTRAPSWKDINSIAYADIAAKSENFSAYTNAASYEIDNGNYSSATDYAQKSIQIFPTAEAYANLAASYIYQGRLAEAYGAYRSALDYPIRPSSTGVIFRNVCRLSVILDNYDDSKELILTRLRTTPRDSELWVSLALLEDKNGNSELAINAITEASKYANFDRLYEAILEQKSYNYFFTTLNYRLPIRQDNRK